MAFIDHELKHLTETYKPRTALDIGAGRFPQTLQMAEEGIYVDAIEPNPPEMPELPSNVTFHKMSVAEFAFPADTYDLIVFRMVAQRLEPDFVARLFADVFPRALKEKGMVYFVIPAKYALPETIEKHFIVRGSHEFDVPQSDFKVIRSMVLQRK